MVPNPANDRAMSEADVRERLRQRSRVLLCGLSVSVALFIASGVLLSPADLNAISLPHVGILAAIMLFCLLGPMVWAERRSARHEVRCPACDKDLSLAPELLFATRSCPQCGARVLAGGRQRGRPVYDRWQRRRSRAWLVYWFWAWPLTSLGFQIVDVWFPDKPGAVWIPLLIGGASNGWALIRTWDLRYTWSFVAYLLLAVSGYWVTC
jgi:hypothetical protein